MLQSDVHERWDHGPEKVLYTFYVPQTSKRSPCSGKSEGVPDTQEPPLATAVGQITDGLGANTSSYEEVHRHWDTENEILQPDALTRFSLGLQITSEMATNIHNKNQRV